MCEPFGGLFKEPDGRPENAGYRPVWIIGAKRLKRMAAQFFRLSAFHWQFFEVHSFSSLLFYCPDARSFYRLHSITPFYTGYSYAGLTTIPLHKANLKDICHPEGRYSVRLPSWGRAVAGFRNKSGRFLSEDAGLIRRLFTKDIRSHFHFSPLKCLFPFQRALCLQVPFLCGRAIYTCGLRNFLKRRADPIIRHGS